MNSVATASNPEHKVGEPLVLVQVNEAGNELLLVTELLGRWVLHRASTQMFQVYWLHLGLVLHFNLLLQAEKHISYKILKNKNMNIS